MTRDKIMFDPIVLYWQSFGNQKFDLFGGYYTLMLSRDQHYHQAILVATTRNHGENGKMSWTKRLYFIK